MAQHLQTIASSKSLHLQKLDNASLFDLRVRACVCACGGPASTSDPSRPFLPLAVSGSAVVEPCGVYLGAKDAEDTIYEDVDTVFIEPVDEVHIEPVEEVYIEPVGDSDVVAVDEYVVGVVVDAEVKLDDLLDILFLAPFSSTTATSPNVLPVSDGRPSPPMLSQSAANML